MTTAAAYPVRVCDDCFAKLESPEAASVFSSLGSDLTKGLESFMGYSRASPTSADGVNGATPGGPGSLPNTSAVPMPAPKGLTRYGSTPRFGTPPRGSTLARQGTPPPAQ
eukprot:Unigene16959_Nuclearia_a/m.49954 Unigene16959_Nuclearia_a/g.49954  ORF Unigene16959_Nuclearia_a/g.49954 Unigene16959_Nuclearia_a/m.49954 type:complete len:110 (+) Unigene16959_Nuclearia_a:126-455(+)